ncbi:unnamed protein product, partial [marine sediment metagenome]
MAQDVFKNLLFASILTALFIFLMLSFAISVANNYGEDTAIFEDETIDFNEINDSLSDIQSSAENWRANFEKSNIFSIIAGIVVTGIFEIGLSMFNFVIDLFNLVF